MDVPEDAKTLKVLAWEVASANREGRVEELLELHYAEDVISIEADSGPLGERETCGLDALRAKHEARAFTVREASVEGPFLHGPDRFGVAYTLDGRDEATGEAREVTEIAVYTIEDGKVVREEFFYGD